MNDQVWRLALANAPKVITLTRATYNMPKDKVESLATFLKANVKASVLEMKSDGDGLTITTTPEVQATIGGLVRLMTQGQAHPTKEFGSDW